MSGQNSSQHVLLRPFDEVIKWARLAASQVAFPYSGGPRDNDYLRSPMETAALNLLREGERALRRLSPLVENPSSHLSQHLRNLILNDEETSTKIRAINVMLYDFEDYITTEDFQKEKFTELQFATKELALTLVEHITNFTTQAALDPLPASKFPALPPLPPLPTPSFPRPDSRMTSSTGPTSAAPPSSRPLQRRPSQTTHSSGTQDDYSRYRSAVYSDASGPISPTSATTSMSGQDQMRNDYFQQLHKRGLSKSNSRELPVLVDRMDLGAITPLSSAALSQSSSGYRPPITSNGHIYEESPPASDTAGDQEYPREWDPLANAAYATPMSLDNRQMMMNEHHHQAYFDSRPETPAGLPYRESIATQVSTPSNPSDTSHYHLRNSAASISSATANTGDGLSVKSNQQSTKRLNGNEIGSDSSIQVLGGFCKSARDFAHAGPGRAIKKVGALDGSGNYAPQKQDFSQEMLFGSMLGATGTDSASEPSAQCQSCDYKTAYSHLRQDIEQDPLAKQQARGIVYRPRFLWKSHVPVKSLDILFGCLFCDKAKSTYHAGDATVFQSVDLLMRHIARHSRPLPPVPGLVILYESDEGTKGRQDYDLLLPSSTPFVPQPSLSAADAENIAALPAARALKTHIHRKNERPLARPDSSSEPLQFLNGGRILGVEFPEKWDGKYGQGWHDGVFGVFSTKFVTLELPHLVNITSLPKTSRIGVTRWKFEAKAKNESGWLTFGKGETIYNLAWDNPHAWFWSGSNAKGQCGIFPKTHMSIESVEDGSLGSATRKPPVKEKSRFKLFSKR